MNDPLLTDDAERWEADASAYGWQMPRAEWWKRQWGIRHIRCAYFAGKVQQNNQFWHSQGLILTGYDNWVLYGIRRGWERPMR